MGKYDALFDDNTAIDTVQAPPAKQNNRGKYSALFEEDQEKKEFPFAGSRTDAIGGKQQRSVYNVQKEPSLTEIILSGAKNVITGPFKKPGSTAIGIAEGLGESTPGVKIAQKVLYPKIPEGRPWEEVAKENIEQGKNPFAGTLDIVANEYNKIFAPQEPTEDAVRQTYRGVGEMGSRMAQGVGLGGLANVGTGLVNALVSGAAANIPFIEKPIASGDWKAAGIDMLVNTAFDTMLFGGGKVLRAIKGPSTLEEALTRGINKGIEPVKVKGGSLAKHGDVARFREDASDAVKILARNKNNIEIVDEATGMIKKAPETAADMVQAIQQTKSDLFNAYDNYARRAGEEGAAFDISKINRKLDKYINDTAHDPSSRKYAEGFKERIADLDGAEPKTIQERIREYNSGLKGFGTLSGTEMEKIRIEASVAEALRQELDKTIESAVEKPGYAELKKMYSKLKSVENEVMHRAKTQARKKEGGLTTIASVFPGMDIAYGIMTQNPAQVAKGVGGKAALSWIKKINDPDRAIKQMFDKAYKWADNQPELIGDAYKLPEMVENLESPAFARQNVPIEQMRRADEAQIAEKAAQEAEARRLLALEKQLGQTQTVEAIKNLRQQASPEAPASVQAMRDFQAGREPGASKWLGNQRGSIAAGGLTLAEILKALSESEKK